jgi:hypothetical protein
MGINGVVSPVVKNGGKVLTRLFAVLVQGTPGFLAGVAGPLPEGVKGEQEARNDHC